MSMHSTMSSYVTYQTGHFSLYTFNSAEVGGIERIFGIQWQDDTIAARIRRVFCLVRQPTYCKYSRPRPFMPILQLEQVIVLSEDG